MKRNTVVRNQVRFGTRWPMIYGNDGFLADGTVLDVSGVGCRVAGTTPVTVGMSLRLWISPAPKLNPVEVEEGRVVWVWGQEFGVEFRQLRKQDHCWLTYYLDNAARFPQSSGIPAVKEASLRLIPGWNGGHFSWGLSLSHFLPARFQQK